MRIESQVEFLICPIGWLQFVARCKFITFIDLFLSHSHNLQSKQGNVTASSHQSLVLILIVQMQHCTWSEIWLCPVTWFFFLKWDSSFYSEFLLLLANSPFKNTQPKPICGAAPDLQDLIKRTHDRRLSWPTNAVRNGKDLRVWAAGERGREEGGVVSEAGGGGGDCSLPGKACVRL